MKQTAKDATFERNLKILSGIIGYFANFHSLMKKIPIVTTPNTIRHTTVAEDHGKLTPPYSSPSSNIIVPLVIVMTPTQSIAFKPAPIGVFGVSISRRKSIMTKASASNGTNVLLV